MGSECQFGIWESDCDRVSDGRHSPCHSCPTALLSSGACPSLSTREHSGSSSSCFPNSLPGKLSCRQTSYLLLAKHFHLVKLLQIQLAPAPPVSVRNSPKHITFLQVSLGFKGCSLIPIPTSILDSSTPKMSNLF